MSVLVDVTFPFWPPSVNHAWQHSGKRTYLSKAGKEFRKNIEHAVMIHRIEKKMPVEALVERLDVCIQLFPPDNRRRDIDNYFKASLDAFTHSKVWKDDYQVKRLTSEWGEGVKGGAFRVVIKPFERE